MSGAEGPILTYKRALARSDGRTLAVLGSSPFGVIVTAVLLLLTHVGDVFDQAVVPILWAGGSLMTAFTIYAGLRRRISDHEWALYTALIMGLLTGIAMMTNEPIIAEQLTSTLMFPPLMAAVFLRPRLVISYGAVAIVLSWAVPLWADDSSEERFIGSLLISVSIFVATGFVAIMRSVLDDMRQQAETMAVCDQLTGLLNRRGMAQQFPVIMGLAERNSWYFAALVADVDHFKRINDNFGHRAGDQVLQQLATVISQLIRPEDLAVRLGGEEFAVLSVVRHRTDAQQMAERLRECVAEASTTHGSQPITISIGVTYATITPTSISDALLEQFINTADDLLYDAKSSGRNCVRAGELVASRRYASLGGTAPAAPRSTTDARRQESPAS